MTRHDKRVQALAICLAALAGYVDAIGFIKSGGFFVSFMSGNSTRLAVGLASTAINAVVAAGLIAAFVVGVSSGSLVGHAARSHRRPVVLLFVAALLGLGATSPLFAPPWLTIVLMALAMGAENAVFEQGGELGIGVTYMTGSLVKVGLGLAGMVLGRRRHEWISYLLLWLGLVIGAVAGALTYHWLDIDALYVASGLAAMLALVAALIRTPADSSASASNA